MKFSGWKIEQMQDLCHEFYNKELKERLRPEILQEIDNHKKRQSKIIVVSAAICPLISIVSNNLDFDDYLCTSLKKNGLVLTGEIGDIPYSKDKVKYLNGAIDLKNYNDVWVYSDHYSDIPMMKMATMPIAVNPDSKLRKFARINKWRVI